MLWANYEDKNDKQLSHHLRTKAKVVWSADDKKLVIILDQQNLYLITPSY